MHVPPTASADDPEPSGGSGLRFEGVWGASWRTLAVQSLQGVFFGERVGGGEPGVDRQRSLGFLAYVGVLEVSGLGLEGKQGAGVMLLWVRGC